VKWVLIPEGRTLSLPAPIRVEVETNDAGWLQVKEREINPADGEWSTKSTSGEYSMLGAARNAALSHAAAVAAARGVAVMIDVPETWAHGMRR
jgi:hypothetical protein